MLLVGATLTLVTALVAFVRARLPVASTDAELALADRLPTWAELSDARGKDAVVDWLGTDLATRVAVLDGERVRAAVPLRLGRLRFFVPLAIVLLMLQLFSPLAIPGASGVLLGDGGERRGDSSARGGGRDRQDSGSRGKQPKRSPPESRPDPGASKPHAESQDSAPSTLPIVPMMPHDEIVVPELVREGPSRKALAPLAELEIGPEAAGGAAAGESGALPERALRDPDAYRRAAERALARRQIPETERAFVRRYFDELARRGR